MPENLNLYIHCRIHYSLPSVPVLSQLNPVHPLPPYFLKTQFNIILTLSPFFPSGLQNRTLCVHHLCMTCPSRFHNDTNNTCWTVQTLKGVTVQLSSASTNSTRLSHPCSTITQVSPLTTAPSPWCWSTMHTPRIVSIVPTAPIIPLHSPNILYCVYL